MVMYDLMPEPRQQQQQEEHDTLREAQRKAAILSVRAERVVERVDRFTRETGAAEDIMRGRP